MSLSRRSFLLTAAAAAGSSLVIPSCVGGAFGPRQRKPKPSGARLRLAVVGVGGRGGGNLEGVSGESIVALCDVDRNRLAAAHKGFPDAQVFADYREALALPDLDGAVISTPDHTHYPAAMFALRRGLDVYCEKPLTHTVAQARRLAEVSRQHGAVTQMGIQIHANENYRRVVEAIRAKVIGDVQRVHVFVNGTDWSAAAPAEQVAVPDVLDYDLWLGPCAEQPYRKGFHPAGWRRYWDFGGGTTADMACHFMDLPFWALELDAPQELQADGPTPHEACAPRGLQCDYWFAPRGDRPAVHLTWWGGPARRPEELLAERGLQGWKNAVLFLGSDGWLVTNYDRHELGPKRAFADYQPPPKTIASSPGHHAEWIECCKARTQPTCSFDYAGPLTETVLLANAAYRGARGVRLGWDSARMLIDGAEAVQALLDRPLRPGFEG